MSKNEVVMTADQYVVAELLEVKAELEEAKKTINHLSSANTYLTIENVKLETNLKEIRKCFSLEEGTYNNIYIKVKDGDGSFGSIFAFQSADNFQDWLKLLDLEKEFAKLTNTKQPKKVEPLPTDTDKGETQETLPNTENAESIAEGVKGGQ